MFEFQPGFILGAQLARHARKVTRFAVRGLEAGALSPLMVRSNFSRSEEVIQTLRSVAGDLGHDKSPVGLLIPDGAVRVGILAFETLPASRKDVDALIRWKMKPLLPFPVEEGRLSFEISPQGPGRVEVLVFAARSAVLGEYESAVESLGGEVRLVLPSTAALLPLLGASSARSELLLHVSAGGLTAVALEGNRIRLWRNQPIDSTAPEDWLAPASEEAARALASCHDHLHLEIERTWVSARPRVGEDWMRSFNRAISEEIKPPIPEVGLRNAFSAEQNQLLEDFGAPISGLMANAA